VLLIAILAAAEQSSVARAAEFTPLGSLPGDLRLEVRGISADGNSIVGGTFTDQGHAAHAFLWTKQAGLEDLGALVPGGLSAATAISGDGRVIVGGSSSSRVTLPYDGEAVRWTREEGMAPLGDLPDGLFSSSATGVSFDGSVIVGTGTTKRGAEAFRWTPDCSGRMRERSRCCLFSALRPPTAIAPPWAFSRRALRTRSAAALGRCREPAFLLVLKE